MVPIGTEVQTAGWSSLEVTTNEFYSNAMGLTRIRTPSGAFMHCKSEGEEVEFADDGSIIPGFTKSRKMWVGLEGFGYRSIMFLKFRSGEVKAEISYTIVDQTSLSDLKGRGARRGIRFDVNAKAIFDIAFVLEEVVTIAHRCDERINRGAVIVKEDTVVDILADHAVVAKPETRVNERWDKTLSDRAIREVIIEICGCLA